MTRYALSAVLALCACRPDYGLSNYEPPDDEEEIGEGNGNGNGNGGDSPWGSLDPGDLPEVYFAVAWDWGYDYCGDGCWEEGYYQPMIAVVDLEGQVIVEFEAPYDYASILALRPAGPGQFDVTVAPWDYGYDDAAREPAASWEVWRADAVTGSFTRILHVADDGPVIDATGRKLMALGTPSRRHQLVSWPSDPGRALVLSDRASCGADDDPILTSAPLYGNGKVDRWYEQELLPAAMIEDGIAPYPWTVHAAEDADGQRSLLTGWLTDCYTYGSAFTAWSPEHGVLWQVDAPGQLYPFDASYSADDGGAVLYLTQNTEGRQIWHLDGPAGTWSGEVKDDSWLARPGPVLDPENASFMTIATRTETGRDALDIYFRDKRVWQIDTFRFGLDEVELHVSHVALITPP